MSDGAPISVGEIIREAVAAASIVGEKGRIEIVIYKTNHELANYEIKTLKRKDGKVTI